jgi:hypothetical protein
LNAILVQWRKASRRGEGQRGRVLTPLLFAKARLSRLRCPTVEASQESPRRRKRRRFRTQCAMPCVHMSAHLFRTSAASTVATTLSRQLASAPYPSQRHQRALRPGDQSDSHGRSPANRSAVREKIIRVLGRSGGRIETERPVVFGRRSNLSPPRQPRCPCRVDSQIGTKCATLV